MKKIILTVASVFVLSFANAQDKKEKSNEGFSNGDVFISGAFKVSSVKTDPNKSNSFEVSPGIGFFVSDNIAVGAAISYTSTKEDTAGTTTTDVNALGFGVFGRYYATPSSKFSVFGQLGFSYATGKNKLTSVKANGFDLAFTPGINYFLNSNFAIEATVGRLGYTSVKNDSPGAVATNSFDLKLDLSAVGFGVNYKF